MGKTGYDSQMTDEPEDPHRPNNLWLAVPGDHGAHGRFDRMARSTSEQWWVTKNRDWLALGAGVAGLLLAVTLLGEK